MFISIYLFLSLFLVICVYIYIYIYTYTHLTSGPRDRGREFPPGARGGPARATRASGGTYERAGWPKGHRPPKGGIRKGGSRTDVTFEGMVE